jgi:hypothetical protein
MAWASATTLGDRFAAALDCLRGVTPRRKLGATYQGFIKNLKRRGSDLTARLAAHLRRSLQEQAEPAWAVEGFAAFALDGSRFDLPRTAALKRYVGRCGRQKSGPQLHLTTLWHLGSGVPWSWMIQKAPGDERGALLKMLKHLPAGALLVMDAGLVGYEVLREIQASGRHFLLRVGANVRLLQKLGWAYRESGATVYLWPQEARREGAAPLKLRLIARGQGKKRVYLLTDLGDKRVLSDGRAGRLYRRRWGVEVFYRSLKQVMEKRKLRSRTPATAHLELEGVALGAMLLGLLQLRSLRGAGQPPPRASFAAALRTLRSAMRRPRAGGLGRALARCLKDRYRRRGPKAAQAWPHKKKEPRPGVPRLRPANAVEIHAAQQLRSKLMAA